MDKKASTTTVEEVFFSEGTKSADEGLARWGAIYKSTSIQCSTLFHLFIHLGI